MSSHAAFILALQWLGSVPSLAAPFVNNVNKKAFAGWGQVSARLATAADLPERT